VERLPAFDAQRERVTGGAGERERRRHGRLQPATVAGQLCRLSTDPQHRRFRRGAAAEHVEVELHGIIDNARQLADHEIDREYAPAAGPLSGFERRLQDSLRGRQLMHV